MANVQTEDISVPWGQAPDPMDYQHSKWRMAVFQDLQESADQTKLYCLYDPIADDQCSTTRSRKAMTCLAVFDVNRRCFVGEIPLRIQGRPKMLFAMPHLSPSGATSFVVTSQSEDYGECTLHVWGLELSADGLGPIDIPRSLLKYPIKTGNDFICSVRYSPLELVVVHGPQLNVVTINLRTVNPQAPLDCFTVGGAEISHFYDGFLSQGKFYFLSSSPDGHLDYSRVHVLSLQSRQLTTEFCHPDPQRGLPAARKQAALDSIEGFILLAGGEIDHGIGDVQRLVDYWVLDLSTFKWNQIPAQMSAPLIEPRLTTAISGNVYVWGDFDDPLPNMELGTTHVRILRVRGLNGFHPPPYGSSSDSQPPPYPAATTYPNQQTYEQNPYGQNPYGQNSYGQNPYGQNPYGGQGQNYPPEGNQYPPQGSQYPPQDGRNYNQTPNYGQPSSQYPYYPPSEKKKDCTIS